MKNAKSTASASAPGRDLLVVVHPGSLCGSANFNLGKSQADVERERLAWHLAAWTGDILVLDGELSDELPSYPDLAEAIKAAVKKAALSGFGARLEAEDPCHVEICLRALLATDMPADRPIHLTGAWYDPTPENWGCVNATMDGLLEAGFKNVTVCDTATRSEDPDDVEDWPCPMGSR